MNSPIRLWSLILLGCTWMAAGALRADDVPWLRQVQQPVSDAPREGVGTLAPLMVDEKGEPITMREAWETKRKAIRDEWLNFLGPMPDPRPEVKLEQLKLETTGGVERRLVRYEGEPGIFVEGYLLRPVEAGPGGKRPGIVALHQTTNDSIDQIAGVSGPEEQALGLKFAQRGFVVFCPRCFLWQDAADPRAA